MNVLHIRYEDLLNDKRQEIVRIVDFLDLDVDDKKIDRAVKYSSFDYMKKHETKFGEQPVEKKKHEMRYNNFIRKGKAGEGKNQFNVEQLALFNTHYDKFVLPFEK